MKSYNEEMSATKIKPTSYLDVKISTSTQRSRKRRLKAKLGVYRGTPVEDIAREVLKLTVERDELTDKINLFNKVLQMHHDDTI